MRMTALTALLLLAACKDDAPTVDSEPAGDDSGELVDADGDGYGAQADCDDTSAAIYPGAEELCNGVDDDCDGTVDLDAANARTWYADSDNDGAGDDAVTELACEQPEGFVSEGGDCDDADPLYFPGASEDDCADPNDYNCDGSVGYADGDGDGYAACEECDDANRAVNPSATEICDGLDNDCDGDVDGGAVDADTFYLDSDGDGFGVDASTLEACERPSGYADNDDDCDDSTGDVNPDADEVCDGVDNDCDGDEDEDSAVDAATWYLDADGDGYGLSTVSSVSCEAPNRYVDNADDCDDAEPLAWTGASESCDEADNDCDGSTDEGVTTDYYLDADGDGYGDDSTLTVACAAPSGRYITASGDCDDSEPLAWTGATETCDEVDNDCDSSTDEGVTTTYYVDADGDGYGDSGGGAVDDCSTPSGYAATDGDCDDGDADYNPGASLGCDGEDYDCDGQVDNDADGDSYADQACGGTDCDDTEATIYPGGNGACAQGTDCLDVLNAGLSSGDGNYVIDPDGANTGEDPIEVYCDMSTDGGGWTLCASLTKGYVPAHMLYDEDLYAFQARLNGDNNYAYETEAPGRSATTWSSSETLNYGQFCRLMGTGQTETWIEAKMWSWRNNSGATLRGTAYDGTYSAVYAGNLFLQWFTNSSSARSFTKLSGDTLYVQSNNNGYGGSYIAPSVGWSSSGAPYSQSTNPWNGSGSSTNCVGCDNNGGSYSNLPYGQTTILNDMTHSFWSGIPNLPYGWSDCTLNGNCTYHESGMGVWLFWVR